MNNRIKNYKKKLYITRNFIVENGSAEKIFRLLTMLIVVLALAWSIIPMLVFRENYVITIHDVLDQFAGDAQYVFEKGTFLNPNQGVDFFDADISKYYFDISYDAYTVLCYGLGYLRGQIIARILGTFLGYLAMRKLLLYIFPKVTVLQNGIICVTSVIYAITPISPIRIFAFGSLPLVVLLFLRLRKEDKFTWGSLLAVLVPFFSMLTSVLVFIICFWFLFTVIDCLTKKKINSNLVAGLAYIGISTAFLYRYMLYPSLNSGETNRSLFNRKAVFWETFKTTFLNGQEHAPSLHGLLLLPTMLLITIWVICYYVKYRRHLQNEDKRCICFLTSGWLFWILSVFIYAFQESGFKVGIALVDGFYWGRIVALMRLVWYIMLLGFLYYMPNGNIANRSRLNVLFGLCFGMMSWYGLRILLGSDTYGTVFGYSCISIIIEIIYLLFSITIFTFDNKYKQIAIYSILCCQLFYVAVSDTCYNDAAKTVNYKFTDNQSDESIDFEEFFSEDLFNEIKSDLNYNSELVAAYGYHPSVLMYNGFETLDHYDPVHSMKMQNQFREIIAPALEYEGEDRYWYMDKREYYDTYGIRMYLFGILDYTPTRDKEVAPVPLFIDPNAFIKYGGKYILSRAVISNSDELGLNLVQDYTNDNSIYHIYVYEAVR